MHIESSYAKETLPLDVPDSNLLEVVVPNEYIAPRQPEILIKEALLNPL